MRSPARTRLPQAGARQYGTDGGVFTGLHRRQGSARRAEDERSTGEIIARHIELQTARRDDSRKLDRTGPGVPAEDRNIVNVVWVVPSNCTKRRHEVRN